MLKGLDPILSPDLLATLRAMGHGDEIAIVDGNYPGVEHARRLVRLDGVALIPALAITSGSARRRQVRDEDRLHTSSAPNSTISQDR